MLTKTTPDWEKYRGNNHHRFPTPDVICGGAVSFAAHIGKPLSARLWEDLVHRLQVTGMCVYRSNDEAWTVGWGPGHVCIYLDGDENVADIHFSPFFRKE